MSPEQAMGRTLNNRSDLFSLGTLLYEMLALQAPFTAQTEIELLFAVRDARKRPLRELRPNIHPEFERIIDKAMERQKKSAGKTAKSLPRRSGRSFSITIRTPTWLRCRAAWPRCLRAKSTKSAQRWRSL